MNTCDLIGKDDGLGVPHFQTTNISSSTQVEMCGSKIRVREKAEEAVSGSDWTTPQIAIVFHL
jgi:hypothetical protein